jgi:hypothetical protein
MIDWIGLDLAPGTPTKSCDYCATKRSFINKSELTMIERNGAAHITARFEVEAEVQPTTPTGARHRTAMVLMQAKPSNDHTNTTLSVVSTVLSVAKLGGARYANNNDHNDR